MRRVATAGAVLTALSLAGYAAAAAGSGFPGQSFTLTGLMVGVTLFAVGGGR